MGIACKANGMPHLGLGVTCPHVAAVLRLASLRVVPMGPRITEEGAENESIVDSRTAFPKDGIAQLGWTIVSLEV